VEQRRESNNAEAIRVITEIAQANGQSLESFTAKFRQQNGGMDLATFMLMPADRMTAYLRSVRDWIARNHPQTPMQPQGGQS
jgi:hypothetical protein